MAECFIYRYSRAADFTVKTFYVSDLRREGHRRVTPFGPWIKLPRSATLARRTKIMMQTVFRERVDIPVPPSAVWPVMVDVERWPEWTASISRVKRLSQSAFGIGSRLRIHQPKLPPAWWRVTELQTEAGFTWESTAPGLRVTAEHQVEPIAEGSRVTLSIRYEGLLGPWLARWTQRLNERYLLMEANGLKEYCMRRGDA